MDPDRARAASARELVDRRVRAGLDLHADDGDRGADVETVRHPVVDRERRDVGLDFEESPRHDHVPLEERTQATAGGREVLVRQHDLHVAVAQPEVIDPVEGEVTKVDADGELSLPDRVRPVGVNRAEAVGGACEDAERGVELVREASRRRGEREGGKLGCELIVQLLERYEGSVPDEVMQRIANQLVLLVKGGL